jgi:hypothetical protein
VERYKTIILKNHPDQGGSLYLVLKINEAKQVLSVLAYANLHAGVLDTYNIRGCIVFVLCYIKTSLRVHDPLRIDGFFSGISAKHSIVSKELSNLLHLTRIYIIGVFLPHSPQDPMFYKCIEHFRSGIKEHLLHW